MSVESGNMKSSITFRQSDRCWGQSSNQGRFGEPAGTIIFHLVGCRPPAGDFKQADYGKVILPFTVLRRLDCVLEPTKQAVLKEFASRDGKGMNVEPFLLRKAGQTFTTPQNSTCPR